MDPFSSSYSKTVLLKEVNSESSSISMSLLNNESKRQSNTENLMFQVNSLTKALECSNHHLFQLQKDLEWALELNVQLDEENKDLKFKLKNMSKQTNHKQSIPINHILNANKTDIQTKMQICQKEIMKLKDFCINTINKEKKECQDIFIKCKEHLELQYHDYQMFVSKKQDELIELQRQLRHYKEKLDEVQKERKQLHNNIQELKGNIQVWARIRPVDNLNRGPIIVDAENDCLKLPSHIKSSFQTKTCTSYTLNHIFSDKETQENIFQKVEPLVTSFVDGYNVCLMAYGQTGSGKTYSLMGHGNNSSQDGICSRILLQLFDMYENQSMHTKWKMKLSCLELYNDQIYDLLHMEKQILSVQITSDGIKIPNQCWIPMESVDQCMEWIQNIQLSRSTAKTDYNSQSSRSHCILTFLLTCETRDKIQTSYFHIVDLAGSERLSTSSIPSFSQFSSMKMEKRQEKLQVLRRKETQVINQSLSALRHVFLQLQQKKTHISYRNSKLTMLLQHAIGGQAKTVVLVCLNPTWDCLRETSCSLSFAQRTTEIELGKAKRNLQKK